MPSLRAIGRKGEDAAAEYLLGLGYTVVTRRYHVKGSEIDIVALDGETLVFVEVKLRRAKGFVPEEGVDARKLKRISVAADSYLIEMNQSHRQARFDLVAIDSAGLRHYVDAFRP